MSGEIEDSNERLDTEARLQKIASFIANTLKPAEALRDEAQNQERAVRDFESRDYQIDAWDSLWQVRADGGDRGLIHLATGLGKTSVAVFDYAKFRQDRLSEGKPARGLFVVHQNNILDQACERFGEILPEINRSRHTVGLKDPNVDMVFTSFQSLRNNIAHIPEDTFDYIIYDEAHHIEAATYKKVVEHFKPAFQLGITATPERMDEKNITDHFGESLYSKTLPEAIAEEYLAKVNYNIVYDDAVQDAMKNDFNSSTMAEIQRLFDVQPRNEVIVDKIRETQALIRDEQGIDQVKTIIFCADMEHADEIADMMGGKSYHSGKNTKNQTAIFDTFTGNGLETITVRDMFNEGIDIPDARLIVFLRTTQSAAVFEQQLGRGLRKNKNKQEVTVLDFVANIERINIIRALAGEISDARKNTEDEDGTKMPNTVDIIDTGSTQAIKVHSDKTEFIFSQEIIDLLDRYNVASSPAPDTWISRQDASILLGISDDAVAARLNVLGISSQFFKGSKGFPMHYISPEVFAKLENYATGIPKDYITVMDAAQILGLTDTTTISRLKKLGLGVERFIQKSGQPIYAIPESYIESLKEYATVPDGVLSLQEAAEVLEWDWGTVRKRAEELNMELNQYVVNKTGQLALFISAEDVESLEHYGEIPDGYTQVKDIAHELRITTQSARTRLDYLDISEVEFQHKGKGNAPKYISDEDADKLREYSTIDKTNFMSVINAARRLNIREDEFMNYVIKLDLKTKNYPGGNGRPIAYIDEQALNIIRDYRNDSKIEDLRRIDGLWRLDTVAKEFNVSDQTIVAWMSKLNIAPSKEQVNKGGRPSSFLSNQDVETIRKIVAPRGYLKIADAAQKIGIGRNTLITQLDLLNIQASKFMGAQGPDAWYISPEDIAKVEDVYHIPDGWVSLAEAAAEQKTTMSYLKQIADSKGIPVKVIPALGKGRPAPYVASKDIALLRS